ncbi:AP-3 complex subunit mu-1-like isoform X1 [Xenia sp. Carnegie-2017]|uniref:AP-3 complex subunit mu-1-like isoform X1 n=1 Tax=Xenia sp. Carnegie-2017 TaxID=2897299 RepID=UPI001F034B92|nr:AP-3 complex subunit mu-1-like isoform X1 [Xenia sp. Carnegie-2017]XP_046843924.1 AP-3 complex subunit mu-1-like isoform X1 [Xenia sp. Carnegie-2017]
MIHSLFIINHSGDIFLEKHWRSVLGRSVCDYFFEAQGKATSPEDIPPVIATGFSYLISIFRHDLFFVSVVENEVPPLFVIEFLHRVVDLIKEYFSDCTEAIIKENCVIVYELLEEMLDNGFPLATESNDLKELIRPPSIVRNVVNKVTGDSNMSSHLPTGQLSNVPWRRTGVKYANNEIYFDVAESIDAIIDKQGSTIFSEIQGTIDCNCKLSGMPDLNMCFTNPRILEDVSFHPCLRFRRWESERILSFVPPDGRFRLISYNVATGVNMLPLFAKPRVLFQEGGSGRFELSISSKPVMGKNIENVVVTVPFPKQVLNLNLTTNVGTYSFDPIKKELSWEIGKIQSQTPPPNIKGNINQKILGRGNILRNFDVKIIFLSFKNVLIFLYTL